MYRLITPPILKIIKFDKWSYLPSVEEAAEGGD